MILTQNQLVLQEFFAIFCNFFCFFPKEFKGDLRIARTNDKWQQINPLSKRGLSIYIGYLQTSSVPILTFESQFGFRKSR